MTQPKANKWTHLLSEILKLTLKTLGELPDHNSKRLIHILKGCEDVLLDGTERPIQLPVDEDRQSACYSGKKAHSIKNNILCTSYLRFVWLSSTYKGHTHDKKICDTEPLSLPKGILLWQDAGLLGHKPDGVDVYMPKRNLKEKNLLRKKSRRIREFQVLGLKSSMPSVE